MRCDQGLFGTEIPAVGTGKQAWLHSEPHFPLLAPSIAKDQSPMAVCESQVQRRQVSVHLGVNVRDQGCALERRDMMPPPRSVRCKADFDSGGQGKGRQDGATAEAQPTD